MEGEARRGVIQVKGGKVEMDEVRTSHGTTERRRGSDLSGAAV